MQIELLDQPILIVRSASAKDAITESPQEALLQIESLLEEEIVEIRNKIQSGEKNSNSFAEYLSEFNLHLQTENEVTSVVLESEWRDQMGDGFPSGGEINEAEEIIDLQVSELMRIVRITYKQEEFHERKKLFKWLSNQVNTDIPLIMGLSSCDYLLVSAKDILNSMNGLREAFGIL